MGACGREEMLRSGVGEEGWGTGFGGEVELAEEKGVKMLVSW